MGFSMFLVVTVVTVLAFEAYGAKLAAGLTKRPCFDCAQWKRHGPNCAASPDECLKCYDGYTIHPLSVDYWKCNKVPDKVQLNMKDDDCRADFDCLPGSYCFKGSKCAPCVNCHNFLRNQTRRCARNELECGSCFPGYVETSMDNDTISVCTRECPEHDNTYSHYMLAIGVMGTVDFFLVIFVAVKYCCPNWLRIGNMQLFI